MKRIATTNAPPPGPYARLLTPVTPSIAAASSAWSPATGALAEGVQAQTHQALKNLQAVLQEAGLTLDNVVKTTVFVQDLGDFGTVMNLRHLLPRRLPRAQLRADRRAAEGSARRDRVHCGA